MKLIMQEPYIWLELKDFTYTMLNCVFILFLEIDVTWLADESWIYSIALLCIQTTNLFYVLSFMAYTKTDSELWFKGMSHLSWLVEPY